MSHPATAGADVPWHRPRLSVVIPALDEAAVLARTLGGLQALRARGHEVILVDGGSTDATPSVADGLVDRLLHARRGRASQMNAGALAARGEVLLFLHADTLLPPAADLAVFEALEKGARWGRFDVRLSGRHVLLRLVERFMNLRSRCTGIATGDQGIFVQRELFHKVGGFPDIELMEDVALSDILRRKAPPACLRERVLTSSRRWESRGVLRTIIRMWHLRLAFALGADPSRLARVYERG